MTTQNTSIGGSTPDISGQEPTAVLAAAEKLRSEEVGKFLGVTARFIGRTVKTVGRAIGDFFTRRQEMAELMRLNDRELADIGLSRVDIYAARRNNGRFVAPANENLPRHVA